MKGALVGTRSLAVVVGALALTIAVPAISSAQRGETAISCSNVSSGASWQIKVDYDRSTVDSNPAYVSDAEISWHDAADSGNYTLDRKSGKLTVIVPSSTGGYIIWDRCKLDN
jgi:hypothetical protein